MSKLKFELPIKKKSSEEEPPMKKSPAKKTKPLIVAMSVVIILCGLYFLVRTITNSADYTPGKIFGNIVTVVGGTIAIVFFRHDIRMGTAVNLMTLGIAYIMSDIFVIVTMRGMLNALDSLTYVVCGIVLLYYGLSLFVGISSGSIKAFIPLAVLSALELIPIIVSLHKGMFILQALMMYADVIVLLIMNILLLIILSRKDMMLPTFVKGVRTCSDQLFSEMSTDPKAYINRYNLKTMMDLENTVGWKMMESGPIERERIIPLFDNRGETEIVLQIWRNDPRLHLTVRRTMESSYNILLSFVAEQLVLDDPEPENATRVRIYGTDGMFVDLSVKDRGEIKVGYIGTIKRKIQKKRNLRLIQTLGDEIGGIVGHDEKE